MGTHVWTIPDLVPYQKSFYASVLVYNASLVLVKASIVLMYRRIFVGKWIQRAIVVALVILTAWGIAVVTSLAMMCLPIQRLWDPTVKGHCIDFVPAFFAPAVINMITDFSIFVMPRMSPLPPYSPQSSTSSGPLTIQSLPSASCSCPCARRSSSPSSCVWVSCTYPALFPLLLLSLSHAY